EGKHLYVPLSMAAGVFGFAVDSSGALAPISGSPFAVGGQPNAVVVDPAGELLFSAGLMGSDGSILRLDRAPGVLTPAAGSRVPVANNPYQVAVNDSGTLLFVSCAGALGINTFTISNGALTPVAPLNGGETAAGVVIVHKSP